MATTEHPALLMTGEPGNQKILYPVTTVDCVDGLDDVLSRIDTVEAQVSGVETVLQAVVGVPDGD